MIRQYLKDSLHWLHLLCFKRRTFVREIERLSGRQALRVSLKVYLYPYPAGLILFCGLGLASEFA
ncbi:MAG TPA: hypothetical protein VFZ34_10580, partial [Blastocatellia bacterium]|nr:hypothetical protein [Blastocatellia bacterium]